VAKNQQIPNLRFFSESLQLGFQQNELLSINRALTWVGWWLNNLLDSFTFLRRNKNAKIFAAPIFFSFLFYNARSPRFLVGSHSQQKTG
jgi:hypothetical protein